MKIKNLKEYCRVGFILDDCGFVNTAIKYKNIVLWQTAYRNWDNYEIALYKIKENGKAKYTIKKNIKNMGLDYCFTYGNWETLEQAQKWLNNPYSF